MLMYTLSSNYWRGVIIKINLKWPRFRDEKIIKRILFIRSEFC